MVTKKETYIPSKSIPADWIPDTSKIAGHTVYRITSKDLSLVSANAEEPGDQAKQSKMPYTTSITGAVPFPWFRYDLGGLKRGERTDEFPNLPPGPNNPVGILWPD